MNHHYTIIIQWSKEDQAFVVTLPEFGEFAHTHGSTYQEALNNATEVLELLVETYKTKGKRLPDPITVDQSFQVA